MFTTNELRQINSEVKCLRHTLDVVGKAQAALRAIETLKKSEYPTNELETSIHRQLAFSYMSLHYAVKHFGVSEKLLEKIQEEEKFNPGKSLGGA